MTNQGRKQRFTKWFAFVCLCAMCGAATAESLGVVGDTFPVAEQSFLSFIESRLQALTDSGEMDEIKARMITDATQHANRPTPVGLSRTNKTQTHRYTPRVVLSHDITDMQGHVLVVQGTSVNALETLTTYQPHWLFFNADDMGQVAWVRHELVKSPKAKVILTGGAVGKMERALNTEIFFDQAGRISHQLGITHVPAKVTRAGTDLLIEEIAIREDGYAR